MKSDPYFNISQPCSYVNVKQKDSWICVSYTRKLQEQWFRFEYQWHLAQFKPVFTSGSSQHAAEQSMANGILSSPLSCTLYCTANFTPWISTFKSYNLRSLQKNIQRNSTLDLMGCSSLIASCEVIENSGKPSPALSHWDVLQLSVTAHGPITQEMGIQQLLLWLLMGKCTWTCLLAAKSLQPLRDYMVPAVLIPLAGSTRDSAAREEWTAGGMQQG